MNIVIPLAGRGSRFLKENISYPKPLYKVLGKSVLEWSISTLNLPSNHCYFVALKYKNEKFNNEIENIIKNIVPNSTIIYLDSVTEGQAETCLKTKKYINNSDPLVITNCDQFLNWDYKGFIKHVKDTKVDGCVSLYNHKDVVLNQPSKYSFVELNELGYAINFKEKYAISNNSLNGIFYWKHGSDFVNSAEECINNQDKTNNEYFVSSTYNYLINKNKKINTFLMNPNEYYSLGSPEEIDKNYDQIADILHQI